MVAGLMAGAWCSAGQAQDGVQAGGVQAGGVQAEIQGQAAGGNCELHVWPTENYLGISSGLLSGFGALGALADHSAHKGKVQTVKDLMRDYLGPQVQMEELRKADVAAALGLNGYRIVEEAPTPSGEDTKDDPARKAAIKDMNAKLKSGARLTASTAPCYAELVGLQIFYHKAMMYGSNLFAGWTFRDFGRAGTGTPKAYGGSVKNPLEDFPPKTPNKVESARVEIRDAYAKDFVEYVRKKVRGAPVATAGR